MTGIDPASKTRPRLTLLAVVAAFVLPIVIAWLMTSGVVPWMPRARLNYGTLIEPPIDLNGIAIVTQSGSLEHRFGEWTLATIATNPCTQPCEATLDHLSRIHVALQEKGTRVHLVVFVDKGQGDFDARAHGAAARTVVLQTETAALLQSLSAGASADSEPPAPNQIFIIDYAGRAMMRYHADADMAGVSRDLRRLLRASKTN
jgi:hypothetical protein